MLEYGLRFLAGGIAVSAFPARGDTLRPKSFAGLFGAAPSIVLATLLITLSQKGAPFAAVEGSTMIVGALALAAYSWTVCVLLKKCLMSSWSATLAALLVWFAAAFGIPQLCFNSDDRSVQVFRAHLRKREADALMISGSETDVCVLATVLDAVE
jgi:hypothetical protein